MPDRPIVYGARYYSPGRRMSHSHLYCIRPDGTGRQQLTAGKADDANPVWSPDGKQIAFSRIWQNQAHPNAICLIPSNGGSVRTLFPVGNLWIFSAQWLSNTHLLVFCLRERDVPGRYAAFVVSLVTGKVERTIVQTWQRALSPRKTHLTAWSDGFGEKVPTRVIRLKDGYEVALPEEVGGTCAWIDNDNFVALSGAFDQPALITCSALGKVLQTVPIRRSDSAQRWQAEISETEGGSSDGTACFIHPLPGRKDCVLVGWQLGGSQQGKWAATYKVNLHNGEASPWAVTDTVTPSPNNRFFLTTRPRDLVPLPNHGSEWGAPLLLGSVAAPTNQRSLVSGLVYVDGFDWRA